jgi:hypothetical protein
MRIQLNASQSDLRSIVTKGNPRGTFNGAKQLCMSVSFWQCREKQMLL